MDSAGPGSTPLVWTGQLLLYGLFAALIGLFSRWPTYRHLAPDQALIKLSFTHASQRAEACRQLDASELAKLPPNMRAPLKCGRARVPVLVEVDIDGAPAVRQLAMPSGLSKDGAAAVYQRLSVAAGSHRIAVRLKNSPGSGGFDYRREQEVRLAPAQVLVIDFDAEKGGITLQ